MDLKTKLEHCCTAFSAHFQGKKIEVLEETRHDEFPIIRRVWKEWDHGPRILPGLNDYEDFRVKSEENFGSL